MEIEWQSLVLVVLETEDLMPFHGRVFSKFGPELGELLASPSHEVLLEGSGIKVVKA